MKRTPIKIISKFDLKKIMERIPLETVVEEIDGDLNFCRENECHLVGAYLVFLRNRAEAYLKKLGAVKEGEFCKRGNGRGTESHYYILDNIEVCVYVSHSREPSQRKFLIEFSLEERPDLLRKRYMN